MAAVAREEAQGLEADVWDRIFIRSLGSFCEATWLMHIPCDWLAQISALCYQFSCTIGLRMTASGPPRAGHRTLVHTPTLSYKYMNFL